MSMGCLSARRCAISADLTALHAAHDLARQKSLNSWWLVARDGIRVQRLDVARTIAVIKLQSECDECTDKVCQIIKRGGRSCW